MRGSMMCRHIFSFILAALLIATASESSSQVFNPARHVQKESVQVDKYNNPLRSPEGENIVYPKATFDQAPSLIPSGPIEHEAAHPDMTGSGPKTAPASPLLELKKQFGVFGSAIGGSGIITQDIDQNGKMDVILGGSTSTFELNDFWYVLEYNSVAQDYAMRWQSSMSDPITRIALLDHDADGHASIFVAHTDGTIEIYDAATLELANIILAPQGSILQILLADADNDALPEIVLGSASAISIYNPLTLQLEHQIPYGANDFKVGNVDADPADEIVLASGYVLEVNGAGVTTVAWNYGAPFGYLVELADIDNDGMKEIVSASEWDYVTSFDADITSPKWQIPTAQDVHALLVGDVDKDGALEVLYADGQWGDINCYDALTGSNKKWKIDNPDHGVTNMAVADTDLDGDLEVLWGAGWTSTGADHFLVYDIKTLSQKWKSLHVDPPFQAVDIGDADGDGGDEIVFASFESNSGYDDGYLFVYDAASLALEWQSSLTLLNRPLTGLHAVRIGDVDDDGVNEILVGTDDLYNGVIYVINGQSHALEHTYTYDSGAPIYTLDIADIDRDGTTEIIAGGGREHTGAPGVYIYVINGATGAVEWKSISLGEYWSEFYALQAGNIDGDEALEIVATNGNLFVFDGISHQMWKSNDGNSYTALDLTDMDDDVIPEILAGTDSGSVAVIDGQTYATEAAYPLTSARIDSLELHDLQPEGGKDLVFSSAGLLKVYDRGSATILWQSDYLGLNAGDFDALRIHRINGGELDVAVGTPYNVSLYKVIPQLTCFQDLDQDGYGSAMEIRDNGDGQCIAADGESGVGTDCNDSDPLIHPGAGEMVDDGIDQDCNSQELCYTDLDDDGYRPDASSTVGSGDLDCLDTAEAMSADPTGDCNDGNALVHPGADEVTGDGFDQDCNSEELCFADLDDDGYRPNASSTVSSADPDCADATEALLSEPTGDCNDDDPSVHPGAGEMVDDGIDQDCNSEELCYADLDDDGYRPDASSTVGSADLDCLDTAEAMSADLTGDCNDGNALIHPGAAEITGDSIDEDCNSEELCYADLDNDGYRPDASSTVSSADPDCADATEAMLSEPTGDCNDGNASIHPGAGEIVADGIDENCDGGELCYQDSDGDSYGSGMVVAGNGNLVCSDPGESAAKTDCDDSEENINPGATEICDKVDNDCDALTDEYGACCDGFLLRVIPPILNAAQQTQ